MPPRRPFLEKCNPACSFPFYRTRLGTVPSSQSSSFARSLPRRNGEGLHVDAAIVCILEISIGNFLRPLSR